MNHHDLPWSVRLFAVTVLALLLGMASAGTSVAKEYVFGIQTDRSGPTQTIGPFVGDGCQDYIKLFNKKQLLGPGNTIRAFEIEHGYAVPRGIESYERHKQAGALSIGVYGTPHTKSLTPKLTEDKILGTSPGFGSADGANGEQYPYLFPIAATYWSQMGGALQFVMDKWKAEGKSGTPKIAYLFYDNPAGREPLPVLEAIAKKEGIEFQTYAVPPPGVEMRPQILDITRKFKADWVVSHLFGKGPSVTVKELSRVRYPIDHLISFVWGFGESDMDAAGWDTAEGYYGLQFAGVGRDHKVSQEIIAMYKAEGQPPPPAMEKSVYYNRGVFTCAVHAEGIRLAIKKYGPNPTSAQVKEAWETISNFDMEGFLPPLTFNKKDHEGGGWVQVWQVKGGKLVPASKWFRGYREEISKMVW
jgi:branched-chain amino acid transport system substrate-binding protein